MIEVDPLCVYGTTENVHEIDEGMKKKYEISFGYVVDVGEYRVIFTGRHQVQFRDGLPVCLYVPPAYKSARDPESHKIVVVIERKLRQE